MVTEDSLENPQSEIDPTQDQSNSVKTAPPNLFDHPDLWRAGDLRRVSETIPSGFAELDKHLPGGGWPRAGLSELLFDTAGIGELRLLLPALRVLSQQVRWIAWVNPPFIPYAPALSAAGIDISRILLIHPKQRREQHNKQQDNKRQDNKQNKELHREALWALERASKSGTCSAVLAWLDERQLSVRDTQRLQLAARQGHTLTCLFRPSSAIAQNSMAELRLAMRPAADASTGSAEMDVTICKRRGGWPIDGLRVRIDECRSPAEVQKQLSLWRHWRGASAVPIERTQATIHVMPSTRGQSPRPVTH